MKDLTVKQLLVLKKELEKEINALLYNFNQKTDLYPQLEVKYQQFPIITADSFDKNCFDLKVTTKVIAYI